MYRQKIESAEWKYYNANPENKSVGDCVKRALTIAYGLDYNEVSKELNAIKRAKHASVYNIGPVFHEFTHRRNNSWQEVSKDPELKEIFPKLGEGVGVRVSDICDNLPHGTYLLCSGEKDDQIHSTHLCVVVDGKLYDSWDSRDWFVKSWCVVTRDDTAMPDTTYEDIKERFVASLDTYIDTLDVKMKMPIAASFRRGDIRKVNKYTFEFIIMVEFSQFPPPSSNYFNSKVWGHELVIKTNPRLSVDENVKILFNKLSRKIYDWAYAIRRDIEDAIEAENTELNARYLTSDDKKFIMHLPKWCRSLVTYVSIDDNYQSYNAWQTYRYEVTIKALPDDPHIKSRGSEVTFYADTLTELKNQLNDYKNHYYRYNYDY